jgi:hypothetical protein
MTRKHLILAFACSVLAVGCAADGPGGDDGGGDDTPASPLGSYAVRSEVRIQAPAAVTAIADAFLDAGGDPAGWLCDTTAPHVSDAGLRAMVEAGCGGLVRQAIDDRLLQIAPNLAAAFVRLYEDVPPLARAFGTGTELRIEAGGTGFLANLRVREIVFGDRVFSLVDFGVGVNVVTDIGITWSAPQLDIAQHDVPIPLGTVARIGLDRIAIPAVEPAAADLAALYARRVDCNGVGTAIFDQLGQGSAAMFAAACTAGLSAAAGAVYQQLDDLDGAVPRFRVTSTAEALDTDRDAAVDRITGSWTGSVIEQGKPPGSLSATFVATRL